MTESHSTKAKCAILISGRGSNMQSLVEATEDESYPAEIIAVISNRPEAEGLKFATEKGIPTIIINHKDYADRESFDSALNNKLLEIGAEIVCLAGFMRLLSKAFVLQWQDRMINIHPSLLPAFRGLHVHEQVLAAGARVSGCTVHFVIPEMDEGPIIIQAAVPVRSDDTPDSLAARVLAMEHQIYPKALAMIANGECHPRGDRVLIKDAEDIPAGFMYPEI